MSRRLWFVVESGTDVRLVEGTRRTVAADGRRATDRRRPGDQPAHDRPVRPAGGASIVRPFRRARRDPHPARTGGGLAWCWCRATASRLCAANLAARLAGIPVVMLVCSPTEAYYACRRADSSGRPFRRLEWTGLRLLASAERAGRPPIRGAQSSTSPPWCARTARRDQSTSCPSMASTPRCSRPSAEPREQVRRRLGLPVDPALIFFSSRIAPEKDPGHAARRRRLAEARRTRRADPASQRRACRLRPPRLRTRPARCGDRGAGHPARARAG